jgi:predicted N-formylglutamate amidohydrolase
VADAERTLILSCEHGGNRTPKEYLALFRGKRRLLASHRGWDPFALDLARRLSRALRAPLIAATTTRLLVDLNRSPHNPAVFSEVTRDLPPARKQRLLARYHSRHWERVRAAIAANSGAVLHLGVHSFTPVWGERRRDFALGILYDPARGAERILAKRWQRSLRCLHPEIRVRRNAPYRGDADGLTAALRKAFSPDRYLGFELEFNQRSISKAGERRDLVALLANTLWGALEAPKRSGHP